MGKLFGWTMQQWGIAIARFPDMPTASISDYLAIRKEWKIRWPNVEPGEVIFEGAPDPMETAAMSEALELWQMV